MYGDFSLHLRNTIILLVTICLGMQYAMENQLSYIGYTLSTYFYRISALHIFNDHYIYFTQSWFSFLLSNITVVDILYVWRKTAYMFK